MECPACAKAQLHNSLGDGKPEQAGIDEVLAPAPPPLAADPAADADPAPDPAPPPDPEPLLDPEPPIEP
jgi:hypothetical protein